MFSDKYITFNARVTLQNAYAKNTGFLKSINWYVYEVMILQLIYQLFPAVKCINWMKQMNLTDWQPARYWKRCEQQVCMKHAINDRLEFTWLASFVYLVAVVFVYHNRSMTIVLLAVKWLSFESFICECVQLNFCSFKSNCLYRNNSKSMCHKPIIDIFWILFDGIQLTSELILSKINFN